MFFILYTFLRACFDNMTSHFIGFCGQNAILLLLKQVYWLNLFLLRKYNLSIIYIYYFAVIAIVLLS